MATVSDDQCLERFGASQRLWKTLAVPGAVIMFIAIAERWRGHEALWLQMMGLGAVVAMAVVSARLCRCPRCGHFLFMGKELSLGWTFRDCPHCSAPLNRKR